MICIIYMVSIVKERGFYYLKHHIQNKEKTKISWQNNSKRHRATQKGISKTILRQEWDDKIQSIGKNYQKTIKKFLSQYN